MENQAGAKSPGATNQQSPSIIVNPIDIECKKICVVRCLSAVVCSVAMQFMLLTIFLLFVNFNIFHPIAWITSTFWLIFSIYTWLWILPLISIVILYGIYLGKSYLNGRPTYGTRFVAFFKQFLPKSLFLGLHCLIGFLTTWLYSRFLESDYHCLLREKDECAENGWIGENFCLNEKYWLISLYGISVAIIYCWKNEPNLESCEFPIIHQSKYLRIRAFIFTLMRASLVQTFVPVIISFTVYNFIGRYSLIWILSKLLTYDFALNGTVHIYDIKLFLIVWILSAQIYSNMSLMAFLFQVFLTEPKAFPIESKSVLQQTVPEVTLVQALGNSNVPIIRQLAALDLYTLSEFHDAYNRRKQIYTLSVPGGHPNNWNALSGQCMSLINAYNHELKELIEEMKKTFPNIKYNNNQLYGQKNFMKSSTMLSTPVSQILSSTPTTASEMADRIRIRQFNEGSGMRNMLSPMPTMLATNEQLISPIRPIIDPCARFNQAVEAINQRAQGFTQFLFQLPGVNYLFGQSEMAKFHKLLSISKAEEIGWILQGLTSIVVHSIQEDRYGVVQTNLTEIISTILQFRDTVNKIPSFGILGSSSTSFNRNSSSKINGIVVIRNAVKRCLYHISITFEEYLPDLINDPNDLRILQNYIEFMEV